MRFLRNSTEKIRLQEGYILLEGIDGKVQEKGVLKKPKGTIVLSHSPFAFDLFDEDQNVLILAGDTHGGQIPIPTWIWRILGYKKCARFNQGLFQKGRKKMYVSRGIGMSHFPLRIFRRPEVVVLYF